MARTVKSQSSYIQALEQKVDSLTALVKKREKPAELDTKKMETMASRLTALAATHPGGKPTNRLNSSDSQTPRSTQQQDETQIKLGQVRKKKKSTGNPHLIVDMSNCAIAQKELSCSEVRAMLQSALKNQSLTIRVILRGLNKDAKNDHRYFVFFDSSKDARKARIHDFWLTIPYHHARLHTGTIIYPVKIHCVCISAVVDRITNTVHESTKKRTEAENEGLEITEICWLSKPDEKQRYGSMLFRLVDEEAANTLLSKELLDVAGESCIVEEWEVQKWRTEAVSNARNLGTLQHCVRDLEYAAIIQSRDIHIKSVSTF